MAGRAMDMDTALVVAGGAVELGEVLGAALECRYLAWGEVLGAALACRCLAVAAQEETAETAPAEAAAVPVVAVTAAVDEPEVPGKARGWIVRCVSPALLWLQEGVVLEG